MTNQLHGMIAMGNDEYHAADGVSKSKLDTFAISPRHYWLKHVNPDRQPEERSEALIIGAASHCAVLEPDLFPLQYAAAPSIDRRTKEGKAAYAEFTAASEGKTILTAEQYAECIALRDCVHADPIAARLLRDGQAEKSFFADHGETGLKVKCRPDYLTGSLMIDLKFVRDASPFGFGRACASHRYDVQCAFYPDVLRMLYGGEQLPFVFIAVEKNDNGPVCAVYYADDDMIAAGRRKWNREIVRLAECINSNTWPGYTAEPQPVQFPKYAME